MVSDATSAIGADEAGDAAATGDRSLPPPTDGVFVRYGVAVAATIGAILARVWLSGELGDNLPFITAFAAMTIAAWVGGILPGLLCAALTYLGLAWFLDGAGVLGPHTSRLALVSLVSYVISSLLIAGAAGAARLYMRRLSAANALLQEKQAWLSWQVEELNRSQRERESLLEREQAARADAQEAHARMLSILESVGDAFYALDEEWRYTYVNARAERYFGVARESMLGRSLWDVFPQAMQGEAWTRFHRVMRSGDPEHFQYLSPVSRRWVDAHVYRSNTGLSVFFEDIHEWKLTEAALQESRMRFEAFMHNSPARAWIKDERLNYVYVNDAARRAAGAEMVGRSDFDLFDVQTATAMRERDLLVLGSGDARQAVDTIEEQGVQHHILSVRFVIEGLDGRRYLAGKGVDISEQIWAQNALREADRRKDEFLATLAHELRNPLSPVRTAAAFLRAKAPQDPQVRRMIEMIDRQVSRMSRLLDDLLDVSRMTFNKLQLRREQVAVAEVVERAVEAVRPLVRESGQELEVHGADRAVFVHGDPARLEQVLSNLLNNAVKYTQPGGRIALTVAIEQDWVAIGVRDDGIGIEAGQIPKLFEMFSQAGNSGGDPKGGLGIGLALVRALVQMHGGTVSVHSDGIGRGSLFTVRLPTVAPAQTAAAAQPGARCGQLAPRLRVLVVDDNEDAVDSLVLLLGSVGHEVRAARDGNAALEVAASFRPDAVLLDIGLPGLSGFDVARWIRRQEWGARTLLIAVTGWGQPEDQRRTAAAGFDHHLTKPVSPDTVERLLATAGPSGRS